MFLPTTAREIEKLGWDCPDVILVTGDAYIDSPHIGIAVIGHVLADAGYRVAVIAQPDISTDTDIRRLGEPRLFWGVSGGSVDSMVSNYTASKKKRKHDDYTPGGINDKRPDRAVIAYTNLIRRFFKNTVPILLGGIEASLRRVAHYDFWSDKVRRSILFDSKADLLLYGMSEKSVINLARTIENRGELSEVRGLCYISSQAPTDYIELPSFEDVSTNKRTFIKMFNEFYRNNHPADARGMYQAHGARYLVHNPPEIYLTQKELDHVYSLGFERDAHPYYKKQGEIRALDTIRFSIPTHRGCYGECNFCSIAVHEGRQVRWRSADSIVNEAENMAGMKGFKGYITDVTGPSANMYGIECSRKDKSGPCCDRRCLYPDICPALHVDHSAQLNLLRRLRQIDGIKKVFVSSGVRCDLVLADRKHADRYIRELVEHHVPGQMKVAPEHSSPKVLGLMGKPDIRTVVEFKKRFDRFTKAAGLKQYLTYYFIAAHPGCTAEDMVSLKEFLRSILRLDPEQVQIFTPTPSTYSSLMYHTRINPFTMKKLFVETDPTARIKQKNIIVAKNGRRRRH